MYPQQLSAPPRRTAALAARARSAPVRLPAAKPTRGNRRQPNLAVRASAAATEPPAAKGDVGSNKLGYFTSNPRADVLAGVTVALALVPEALAFTFVAGVHPLVGLHGAILMCAVTALLGGRPGMISGAAGATAVVTGSLVASHGPEYLFACMAMAGGLQLVFGVLRLGKLIRLVPQPAMLGFVNGLAIVILSAQAEHFQTVNAAGQAVWLSGAPLATMAGLVALTIGIITILPKLTRAVPAPLVAIGTVTALVQSLGIKTKTIGDLAAISGTLPVFHVPAVPFGAEAISVIAPYAAAVAAVGLIESLLTQNLVDEITQSRSPTHTECMAQGLGNVVNGFFSGMGGCAMIGQTMINMNSGGRGRLSGVVCASAIALFVVAVSSEIENIPLAALVGVMCKVVFDTFAWNSFNLLPKIPKTDAFVLVAVTASTVVFNLAVAVIFGVVISALGFAYKQSQRVVVRRQESQGGKAAVYAIEGPLFFGSDLSFKEQFNPADEALPAVILDFANCRVWDQSGLEAISAVAGRYADEGKQVRMRHLSDDCRRLLNKAGDMVDLEILPDDPKYGLSVDYNEDFFRDAPQVAKSKSYVDY